jgi:hypothetical protein
VVLVIWLPLTIFFGGSPLENSKAPHLLKTVLVKQCLGPVYSISVSIQTNAAFSYSHYHNIRLPYTTLYMIGRHTAAAAAAAAAAADSTRSSSR